MDDMSSSTCMALADSWRGGTLLWCLPATAGEACDIGSGSRSGGEGTCVATGTRHRMRGDGGGRRGGGGVACKGEAARGRRVLLAVRHASRGPECADPRSQQNPTLH